MDPSGDLKTGRYLYWEESVQRSFEIVHHKSQSQLIFSQVLAGVAASRVLKRSPDASGAFQLERSDGFKALARRMLQLSGTAEFIKFRVKRAWEAGWTARALTDLEALHATLPAVLEEEDGSETILGSEVEVVLMDFGFQMVEHLELLDPVAESPEIQCFYPESLEIYPAPQSLLEAAKNWIQTAAKDRGG
eukprot:s2365_g6.t1